MTTQRLRSVLYMPGANQRALEKAKSIPADAFILDLEDAVAPSAKEEARELVCAAVAGKHFPGRIVTIRVNSIATHWHEQDLRSAALAGPDAVVIPKVNSADDIHAVERVLEMHAPEHTRIWPMLETPRAVLGAAQIASCSDRVSALIMGTNDLAKELCVEAGADRAPLLASLSMSVLGARAHGKAIVDGVYNDIRNLEGFVAECEHGRRLGFDGKTLIHPSQVNPCNAVFTPSAEEVTNALRIIQAFEEAERSGAGVVTVDGRLIENLHIAVAKRTLSLAAPAEPATSSRELN